MNQIYSLVALGCAFICVSCANTAPGNRQGQFPLSHPANIRYDAGSGRAIRGVSVDLKVSLQAIEIKPKHDMVNLAILEDRARAYLSDHYATFGRSGPLYLNVQITPSNEREYYSLFYYGPKVGGRYWVAMLDSSGKASGHRTDIEHDTEIPR